MNTYPLCVCEGAAEYNAQQLASYGELNGEGKSFNEYLEGLTKMKKKIAMTAIGLYLRDTFKSNCKERVNTSADVYNIMHPIMFGKKVEEFWVLFLSNAYRVLGVKQLSGGGLTCTIVDVRVLMKEALLHSATSIVVCHNHPSGNLRPSREDNTITNEIVKAGDLLNIRVLDHVIISDASYYSYADYGTLRQ